MKILVLGGGQQGRVIATDLAYKVGNTHVDVADVRQPQIPERGNLRWLETDLADVNELARRIREYDLAVSALPSQLGFGAMQAAIEARRPLVDVSFSAADPLELDEDARHAGVAIFPDCGLAPGLTHLCAGHAAVDGTPDEITMYVGGVSQDRTRPYGYVVTWSLEDLLEEYVRPARVVREGRPTVLPAFADVDRVQVPGVGEMESYLSDGLRTIISTMPEVRTMSERTLRWPGHAEAVRPLVESGRLLEEFREKCTMQPPRDLVAMMTVVRRGMKVQRATLIDRYDEASQLTAMARTTALTTSAVAQWVAGGGAVRPGVQPLERVGPDQRAYTAITSALEKHGVRVQWDWGA
jgi:saccharopine dehydrogenase-like NADP-dependent oxidoreductase